MNDWTGGRNGADRTIQTERMSGGGTGGARGRLTRAAPGG